MTVPTQPAHRTNRRFAHSPGLRVFFCTAALLLASCRRPADGRDDVAPPQGPTPTVEPARFTSLLQPPILKVICTRDVGTAPLDRQWASADDVVVDADAVLAKFGRFRPGGAITAWAARVSATPDKKTSATKVLQARNASQENP